MKNIYGGRESEKGSTRRKRGKGKKGVKEKEDKEGKKEEDRAD